MSSALLVQIQLSNLYGKKASLFLIIRCLLQWSCVTSNPQNLSCLQKQSFFILMASLGGSDGKESACNAGDPGLIPGEGNGNPLQYSCSENSIDRGAWRAYNPWTHKESDTTKKLMLSLSGGWLISAEVGQTQIFRLVLVCSIFSTLDSRRRPCGEHPSHGGSQELKRGKQEHKIALCRTS